MLSKTDFIKGDTSKAPYFVDLFLAKVSNSNNLAAHILCNYDTDTNDLDVVASWPLPVEIWRGAERIHIDTLFVECEKVKKPHCHSISNIGIHNVMRRYKPELQGLNRCWFIPLATTSGYFIYFGFPVHSDKDSKNISGQFIADLAAIVEIRASINGLEYLRNKMNILDRYVKEVGHDIASSVQATVAKLRNISDGLIESEFISAKAAEAENEIMAAYRVSECLGLTMDSDYQIKEFNRFNLNDVIQQATYLHSSEANEKYLSISLRSESSSIELLGDEKAMEQAVGHLLSNAIKYSYKNTKIELFISKDSEYASLVIRNLGISLPDGKDRNLIWQFGERGQQAMDFHVNGSGIGLFTVKKIVLAHFGNVNADHDKNSKLTTFTIKIPLYIYLKKTHPEVIVNGIASKR